MSERKAVLKGAVAGLILSSASALAVMLPTAAMAQEEPIRIGYIDP